MTNNFVRNFAIATSLSIGAIACTPTATTTPTTTATTTTTTSTSSTPTAKPTTAATTAATTTAATTTTTTTSSTEKAPDTIRISVVNNSGKVLTAVYMSAPDKKDWGVNEIEGQPLPDREKADFEWKKSDYKGSDAGCVFDVRAEYQDGKETELDGLDLCKTPAINLK